MSNDRQAFGRRGGDKGAGSLNIYAGSVDHGSAHVPPESGAGRKMASRNTIYRPGESERPTFHGSHIERHWPKYGAVAFAGFALAYAISERGFAHPVSLAMLPLFAAGFGFLALRGIREMVQSVHLVRTRTLRTRAFTAGVAAGLLCFLYTTFIDPQTIMGIEWGLQSVFNDGFQREDLSAALVMALQAFVLMAGTGLLFEKIAGFVRKDRES
ncbi:hypothetical protein [Afifella sp. IM 167]|uniref:hypothetical protein n=1 Tax=Afifella sp. IM 167 TaxID=2033586 RepID=UPI001CCF3670|nr:hypothetical protein [Afifella sp. IM 167]MBZ8132270.1 hypothetical protein [Afifella sp. IM 167]